MMMWATLRRTLHAAAATFVGMPRPNVAAAVGAMGALFAATLGTTTQTLLIWLAVMMGADLVAGLLRALRRADEHVRATVFVGGMIGKFLRMLLVVPAVGVEKVMAAIGIAPPAHALPMLAVCALILFECASIAQNIQAAEGQKFWPARFVKRAIRVAQFEFGEESSKKADAKAPANPPKP